MFKQIAVILFFIAFTIQCAAQDNATEFINITYKTLTGASNTYFLGEDKEAAWNWDKDLRDLVKSKCSGALPVNLAAEIYDNIPTERIFEKWNCADLINANCVKEDSLNKIKNNGGKIFFFENPVFNNNRTYAMVWVSIATKMHGSHWIFIFKKGKKKWKKHSKIFLWIS